MDLLNFNTIYGYRNQLAINTMQLQSLLHIVDTKNSDTVLSENQAH